MSNDKPFRIVELRDGRVSRELAEASSLNEAEEKLMAFTLQRRRRRDTRLAIGLGASDRDHCAIVDERDVERVVRPSADQREVSELYTLAMRLVSFSDACPERVVRTVVDMLHDDAARETTSKNDKRRAIAAAGMILEYLEGR